MMPVVMCLEVVVEIVCYVIKQQNPELNIITLGKVPNTH